MKHVNKGRFRLQAKSFGSSALHLLALRVGYSSFYCVGRATLSVLKIRFRHPQAESDVLNVKKYIYVTANSLKK